MSELHDRFEKLARRGEPRGADQVLAAATREADTAAPLAGIETTMNSTSDDPGELAPVVAIQPGAIEPVELHDDGAPRRRRRRTGAVIAAAGVAATMFVGVLAIGSFIGNGGGSDSPEGAVRQLASAVSHSDPLAAADVLAPNEVRSLDGTISAAEKRAQELKLVNTASEPLAGLDLSVDDLNLSTQSLGAGYAKVTVTSGTIAAHTDKPRFSPLMQRALRDSGDNTAHANLATLGQEANLPTFVVTVQSGGHWYVSAAYTALEYVREANHLPDADFGSGVKAEATLGSDSPDAAVSDMVHALSTGDWQKLISLAPPDEIPVYDYRAALLQLAQDSHPNFTIGSLDTTSVVTGDTAKVKLKASGTSSSGEKWSVDGSCFTGAGDVSVSGGFSSDGALPTQSETGPPSTECGLGSLFLAGAGTPTSGATSDDAISTVKEDGRWFVSPVGTVLDLVNEGIAGVTQDELYTLLNVPDLLPPDGALTLGRPITLSKSISVYTFAGHQGEQLLGLSDAPSDKSGLGFDAGVRVFGPDGKELEAGLGVFEGSAVTLPTDGAYTFVFQPFSDLKDTTVTIWDAAQAPEKAKHPAIPSVVAPGSNESCTFSAGVETCTATSSTSAPAKPTSSSTTLPGG